MERVRYLNWSSWTSCLIKLDSFISQNHRCHRFGVNELHFAHLSYLLGNYFSSWAPTIFLVYELHHSFCLIYWHKPHRCWSLKWGKDWFDLNILGVWTRIIALYSLFLWPHTVDESWHVSPSRRQTDHNKNKLWESAAARLRKPVAACLKDAVLHSAHRTI